MRQLDMQVHRCDASPIPGDTNANYCSGSSCRRLQRVWERHRLHVILRLLHIATERGQLPDFELKVCLDDTCAAVPPRPAHASSHRDANAHAPQLPWRVGATCSPTARVHHGFLFDGSNDPNGAMELLREA